MTTRTIKCKLKTILDENNQMFEDIQLAVTEVSIIMTHVYQFIKLWMLEHYHNQYELPVLTEDLLLKIVQVLAHKNLKKDDYDVPVEDFYNNHYKHLNVEKLQYKKTSVCVRSALKQIITSFENNIQFNYIKYIRRFLKIKTEFYEKKLSSKEKGIFRRERSKTLSLIMQGKFMELPERFAWFSEYHGIVIPSNFEIEDLQVNPQCYLKYMIYLNLFFECHGKKTMQPFPQKKGFISNYVTFDSTAILHLSNVLKTSEYNSNIHENRGLIWGTHFEMKNKIFKHKGEYNFDYSMQTDGYACSLIFVDNKKAEQNEKKNNARRNGRAETNELKLTKTEEEIKNIRKTKEQIKKEENKQRLKENKKMKNQNKENIKLDKDGFMYFNDLEDDELTECLTNFIAIDPGKNTLLQMLNNIGEMLAYTNRQRIHETKRLKYQTLRDNFRREIGIRDIEEDFEGLNSKSCFMETYENYVYWKNLHLKELMEKYNEEKFRKLRWFSYINTCRAEDRLINRIKETYGKDVTIIIGDWSQNTNHLKNFMSTPMIGLKRVLSKHFRVLNINEYKTSAIHYKTDTQTKNLYVPDKKGITRKLHSVLTYQTEKNGRGCINRDKNGVKNMLRIINQWTIDKTRPEALRQEGLTTRKEAGKPVNGQVVPKPGNGCIQTAVEE